MSLKQKVNDRDATEEYPPISPNDIPEFIKIAMQNAGWDELTDVQAASMPVLLERQDAMVQAQTGSGKTGAFILPLIARIDPLEDECQSLILVPTRELALQVMEEAKMLTKNMGINVIPVYGGVGYGKQLRGFEKGAHIVVGTPGRVIDHLKQGSLDLSYLHTLIFDEADRMLSMGFYYDMMAVKSFLPKHEINACMFSATIPVTVRSLAHQFLSQPAFLNLSTDNIAADDLRHVAYRVDPMEKDRALMRLLEIENPEAAVIFCNTKQRVNYVTVVLQRYGYDADQLTSDLSQKAREKVLDRIRDKRLRLLVATDVAARGIDIPHLTHAFQYEMPDDLEVYIHRAGRTGRAGEAGEAFALVGGLDELQMHKISKKFDVEFEERPAPTDDDVALANSKRLLDKLRAERDSRDPLVVKRGKRFVPFIKDLADNDEALELVSMLIDDFYEEKF